MLEGQPCGLWEREGRKRSIRRSPLPLTATAVSPTERQLCPPQRVSAVPLSKRQITDRLDPNPGGVARKVGQRDVFDVDDLDGRWVGSCRGGPLARLALGVVQGL